jgi:hypothetical protein
MSENILIKRNTREACSCVKIEIDFAQKATRARFSDLQHLIQCDKNDVFDSTRW